MTKNLGLIQGRHEIPNISGYVFDGDIEDVTDTEAMEATASKVLEGVDELHLYVTGLTVALTSVLNVCLREGIEVVLYHFDRDLGAYFPQVMFH